MRPFVLELGELQNKILEMGGLVETSIHNSIRSLVERDDALMVNIWESEERINQLDIEIDEFATRLLALYQPVARDLRFLTAAIKINSDLERMGDLAVNIAQRSISLLSRPQLKPLIDVPHMSKTVESMVRKSLDAFVQRDEALARSVLLADDEVDDLKDLRIPGTSRDAGIRPGARGHCIRSDIYRAQPRAGGGPCDEHRRGRTLPHQRRRRKTSSRKLMRRLLH